MFLTIGIVVNWYGGTVILLLILGQKVSQSNNIVNFDWSLQFFFFLIALVFAFFFFFFFF